MTTDSQKRSLKQWHKMLFRLTLPFIWVFLLGCTVCTFVFLIVPCGILAFVSWTISGDYHYDYIIKPAIFPMALGFIYIDWLKTNDVIKS